MHALFATKSTAERRNSILTAPPLRTLIMLSLPALLLSTVQAMMPFTDGLFINNLASHEITAAISFSQPIIAMMLSVSQGLSVAATALIGQLNGKNLIKEGRRTAVQIFVLVLILGVFTAPLLIFVATLVSASLKSEIAPYVHQYIAWYSLILPFSFLESVYNGIKNANGKPEAAFIRMVLLCILKIAGNILFLAVLKMEIMGCIFSSLMANACITAWMFYELFFVKSPDILTLHAFRFDLKILKQVLQVGFPAMCNYAFLHFGFFLINKELEKYGTVVVAAQGIAANINALCFNLPTSFSAAVTTMVSMTIGAGLQKKAQRACLLGCITASVVAVILIGIMIPATPYLTVLFRREQEILSVANEALNIYTYSIIGFGICMTIQGAFIGLGKTKIPLILGLLRIWILRYVFVLATEHVLGYTAVFWGNLFSNIGAATIASILIVHTKWEPVIAANKKSR